jgi:hypothetical protein
MNWDTVVPTLKTKYQSLKGQGLWTPQATYKKEDDEIAGLHAAISKLSAQVRWGTSKGGSGETCCYGCHELGHISWDTCPKKRTSSGSRILPKDKEPHTKTLDGASYL